MDCGYQHAYFNRYTHIHSDEYTNQHAHLFSYKHIYSNEYLDTNSYLHADPDIDCNECSHRDSNAAKQCNHPGMAGGRPARQSLGGERPEPAGQLCRGEQWCGQDPQHEPGADAGL